MAFVSKFCFWSSVRLGGIITGILTLVQASVLLGVTLYCGNSLAIVTDILNKVTNSLQLEGEILTKLAEDPNILITLFSTFFSCLICSSISLLFGCYQCKSLFMYPFVFFYLLYILGLFGSLLLLIFLTKVKGNGLGDLILYSNLGGFTLLFYLYTWSCVVSLIQIINELKQRLKKKLKVVENVKSNKTKVSTKNKTKGFHNYAHFN